VHARTVNGSPARFGHRGWLWKNSYILYDVETDSLWHHLTGRALSGPLRGTALARWRTELLTWEAWRDEHPDTLALPKPARHPGDLSRDGYAARNSVLRFGLGVEIGEERVLYPFADLADGPVEDEIAGIPVVVAADRTGRAAFAWDRRIDGRAASFEPATDRDGAPVLQVTGGGPAFRLRSGRAVGGDREGLHPVFSTQWEVGAWRAQHPNGRLHEAGEPR